MTISQKVPMIPESLQLLQHYCQQHQQEMFQTLERLVELESPSDNKSAVDALGACLAAEFDDAGCKVKFHRVADSGDHLQAGFRGKDADDDKPVLLLGHFDTVWPMGTLASMPFRLEDGRVYGPGVFDMNAGIVMMLFAMRALRSTAGRRRPLVVLLDTDEEVGSVTGRAI